MKPPGTIRGVTLAEYRANNKVRTRKERANNALFYSLNHGKTWYKHGIKP